MKRKHDDRRTVAVALWLNGIAGRDILTGIFCYARSKRHAAIRILPMPADFSPAGVARLIQEGVNGIIAGYLPDEQTKAILDAHLPLVIVGPRADKTKPSALLGHVDCDNTHIGELGARHLLECGSRSSYGFVGAWNGVDWSDAREAGFRKTLATKGADIFSFHAQSHTPGAALDRTALADWLSRLPKPTAVMAAYDDYALQVLDVCRRLNLAVPAQVSVLGVDNDDLLCDFAIPALSSVNPDHERAGYLAGQVLSRLFSAPATVFRHPVTVPLKGIVARASTAPMTTSGNLVARALDFISQNVSSGIGVDDVVRHLRVSRRLLDLRFRETKHRSIHSFILEMRLRRAERMLRHSRRSICSIAPDCGFKSVKTFEAAFVRKNGVSPRVWRARLSET